MPAGLSFDSVANKNAVVAEQIRGRAQPTHVSFGELLAAAGALGLWDSALVLKNVQPQRLCEAAVARVLLGAARHSRKLMVWQLFKAHQT